MIAPTIDIASRIRPPVELDDPAETFHEASRLSPATIGAQIAGSARLGGDPLLQTSAMRASCRHTHRPSLELPPLRLPRVRLRDALERRRSALARSPRLRLSDLSSLLAAGYGSSPTPAGHRRLVPSAGALYPLELYVLALDVDGLVPGVHHYAPYDHVLEQIDARDLAGDLAAAVFDPVPAGVASVALVTTAMLPRTQFKYGQRGYRFALLEAGHVAQNLVLTAAALGVDALPYGGFYDRRVDALVGADGVDEVSVNMLFAGGRG